MREQPYEGITGGKTGFVDQSGFTLATTAERENLSLIVITLNSNFSSEVYRDTIHLLDYAFGNFQTSGISEGTTFMLDEQKYKTGKKLYYTHALGDQMKHNIKAGGILEIVNQDDAVVNSFFSEEIKKPKSKTDTRKMTIKKEIKEIEARTIFEKYFINMEICGLE